MSMFSGKLLKMSMEELVGFLQGALVKDFGYDDDHVIETLRASLEELHKAKMDIPPNLHPNELPQKPFGLFAPPSVEQILGRRTLQSSKGDAGDDGESRPMVPPDGGPAFVVGGSIRSRDGAVQTASHASILAEIGDVAEPPTSRKPLSFVDTFEILDKMDGVELRDNDSRKRLTRRTSPSQSSDYDNVNERNETIVDSVFDEVTYHRGRTYIKVNGFREQPPNDNHGYYAVNRSVDVDMPRPEIDGPQQTNNRPIGTNYRLSSKSVENIVHNGRPDSGGQSSPRRVVTSKTTGNIHMSYL